MLMLTNDIKSVMYLQVIQKTLKTNLCSSSIETFVPDDLNSALNRKIVKNCYMFCLTQVLREVLLTIDGLLLERIPNQSVSLHG